METPEGEVQVTFIIIKIMNMSIKGTFKAISQIRSGTQPGWKRLFLVEHEKKKNQSGLYREQAQYQGYLVQDRVNG